MDFRIEVDHSRDPYAVVAVQGDIDVSNSPVLRNCLAELMSQGSRQIVIDLERVEFLDSTGLGVLLGAFKRLATLKGELSLVNPAQHVWRLLETTDFTSFLRIEPTVEAATGERRES